MRLLDEHKKNRVPEEPRDFVDCYLDELDKVCEKLESARIEETRDLLGFYQIISSTMVAFLISEHKSVR